MRISGFFKIYSSRMILFSIVLALLFPKKGNARTVNNVEILSRVSGYEVLVNFVFPLRYINHRPKTKGKILRILLRPASGVGLDNPETLQELIERQLLSWDREIPIPLAEMTYEGGSADRPEITMRFSEEVEFDVRSSKDLRTLVVVVKVKQPTPPEIPPEKELPPVPGESPTFDLSKGDPKTAELMDEAGGAIKDGNYRRAIQLFSKVLSKPDTGFHRDALEWLGLARERNKQYAHAKAIYEQYLEKYKEGPGAERVNQRLQGLLTARKKPREKLRPLQVVKGETWKTDVFGSFSEFYFFDLIEQENGERDLNQSELSSTLDFNTRSRKGDVRYSTQFFGINEHDFLEDTGSGNRTRINILTVEGENTRWGLLGRVGRQSQSSGGVIGRYDGGLISYDIHSKVRVNAVGGYPVAFTSTTPFDTEKVFYGLNFDLGSFYDYWNFNIFGINQEVDGITDRRAVGGEIRFAKDQHSFFTFTDYDLEYDRLNIMIFNGSYMLPTKTRINLALDYRRSPILTTSNALIGQTTATQMSQLRTLFTEDEIKQLARDRTGTSKSATFGVTQDIGEDYQWIGEITVSELSGTVASGGVEATPGTGTEYFLLTQLIRNNLFWEGDIYINEFRYSSTLSRHSYTLNFNFRLPVTQNFRINPRLQINYQTNKADDDDQITISPNLRLDYRWKRWLRFEIQGGREWRQVTALGDPTKTIEYFAFAGVRIFY